MVLHIAFRLGYWAWQSKRLMWQGPVRFTECAMPINILVYAIRCVSQIGGSILLALVIMNVHWWFYMHDG